MPKLLKLVTSYQSAVTILDSKLSLLSQNSEIDLHVASSQEDPSEQRTPKGKFHQVDIARTIRPLKDFVSIVKIYRLIRRESFDVVHTHTAKAGIVGAFAAKLAGVPLICHTYHGLPFFKGQKPLHYFIYKCIEIVFSKVRHVLFSQNKSDYNLLKSIKSITCPVIFEGNGVNIRDIEQNASKDSKLLDPSLFRHVSCTSGPNPRTSSLILCIARLEPVKRLEKVIAAIEYLLAHNIQAHCIIAGKGHLQGQLQASIQSKGLADRISVVYTPYVHALIAKADIVVLTSEKEGIPRGLMEAMALKKPVVATDVLGTNELVVDRETGYLVPLEDQDALNRRLLELVENKALQEAFGQAGYQRIAGDFDDAKIVQLWINTYIRYSLVSG